MNSVGSQRPPLPPQKKQKRRMAHLIGQNFIPKRHLQSSESDVH